jgi:hypothetical protein
VVAWRLLAMKKVLLWVWRVVIGASVLVLIPLSLWYLIGAISTLGYKDYVSNSLPIPFVPELVSAPLGLVLMTWGMVALWWLVFNHERLSLRQIAPREGNHWGLCIRLLFAYARFSSFAEELSRTRAGWSQRSTQLLSFRPAVIRQQNT